jgi:hypothetical protein
LEKDGPLNLNFLEGYVGEKVIKEDFILPADCDSNWSVRMRKTALHGISSLWISMCFITLPTFFQCSSVTTSKFCDGTDEPDLIWHFASVLAFDWSQISDFTQFNKFPVPRIWLFIYIIVLYIIHSQIFDNGVLTTEVI